MQKPILESPQKKGGASGKFHIGTDSARYVTHSQHAGPAFGHRAGSVDGPRSRGLKTDESNRDQLGAHGGTAATGVRRPIGQRPTESAGAVGGAGRPPLRIQNNHTPSGHIHPAGGNGLVPRNGASCSGAERSKAEGKTLLPAACARDAAVSGSGVPTGDSRSASAQE